MEAVIETNAIQEALDLIIKEHVDLSNKLQFESLSTIIPILPEAENIFLIGAGRTGFMIKAAAMRLMHLGFSVHVVGETTTPAIGKGDVLIAASGSGTTSSIVKAAETARKNDAKVICFTTNAESPLAQLAKFTIKIPAAGKQDHHGNVSAQYAGSLFEQAFLLVFDALIQHLWKQGGSTAEELWKRHANME
ncbi:6-phospho-3-hexuloisomerase [Echinicola marina]|uniref:6-phospho-3-hexuloisomerase n=1 Tax=Echinicola marina TaxID=2859768 RepID=UPI001CF67B2B|nr:6-phospho-3-hexuloisomerase [Echinicola marina]UCS92563.1 6-phospho-3-hexuloisomerase [Echinicola marina]